jgi:hypothetical protein
MTHSSLPWIVRKYYPKPIKPGAIVIEHADIVSVPDDEPVAIGLAVDNAEFIVMCVNHVAKSIDYMDSGKPFIRHDYQIDYIE